VHRLPTGIETNRAQHRNKTHKKSELARTANKPVMKIGQNCKKNRASIDESYFVNITVLERKLHVHEN